MMTTLAVVFAVIGWSAMHGYRTRYDRDGTGWWQLLVSSAVTVGLVIEALALNHQR